MISPQPNLLHDVAGRNRQFLPRFFGIKTAILLIDYLPKGQTINAQYYSSLLVQSKDTLKEKHRGKVTKGVLFLHDNVLAHRAFANQNKLAYLGFQCLDHPPYSPDLAPSDYHLFPGIKKNNRKVAIFHPTRRTWLPQRPGWTDNLLNFSQSNGLRSVLSLVGCVLNKARVWSLQLVSFLVGLRTYQHPFVINLLRYFKCI